MPLPRKTTAMALGFSMAMAFAAHAEESDASEKSRHVLLLSIDGMHAVDFQNCIAANTCPGMAALAKNGVNYRRTSTSKPSIRFRA
jgi:Type I phosphodiesterase / nucleotide pyrophosphatase